MVYVIVILAMLCLILILYVIVLRLQLRSINYQLQKRALEESRQLLTLSFQNKELTQLALNVNRCLTAEEKSLNQARKSEKDFKQLIANLSHDLRTPLTAIRGYLQLIAHGDLSISEKKNLDVAMRYTDELGQLIEHFFEYTYLVDAKPEMNLQELNLTNLVMEVLADSVTMFEEQGIAIEIEEGPGVMAFADREMTIRILQNLIRNCIAHSGGNLKVWIDSDIMARIHFQNPLKPNYHVDPSRIFDRFYTGDSSRHRTTGLGLSIVKLLSKWMGGKAEAAMNDNLLELIISLPKEVKKEVPSSQC